MSDERDRRTVSSLPVRGQRFVGSTKPWLNAGRSHDATAQRLLTHHLATCSWWERLSPPPEISALRARAKACRRHARQLDRLHARGWLVFHDQVLADTGDLFDHVLVGPTGVAVLYTLPTLDHDQAGWPGPRSGVEADAAAHRWSSSLEQRVINELDLASVAADFTDGEIWVNARVVLFGARRARTDYDAYLVPSQVFPWLTGGFRSSFNPLQVQQVAAMVSGFLSPAPVEA